MKRVDMRGRIEEHFAKGQTKDTIKELFLDNCRSQRIDGLNEEFVNLQVLSLNNVGLVSLDGFPRLQSLRKLELSDNKIAGGLVNLIGCPNLSYLNLSGNKIKDINELEPLIKLENLRKLDLFNCEVTNMADFRDTVFRGLPNLKYLDGIDREGREDEMADEDDDDADEELQDEEEDEFIENDGGEIPDEFYEDSEEEFDEEGEEEEEDQVAAEGENQNVKQGEAGADVEME